MQQFELENNIFYFTFRNRVYTVELIQKSVEIILKSLVKNDTIIKDMYREMYYYLCEFCKKFIQEYSVNENNLKNVNIELLLKHIVQYLNAFMYYKLKMNVTVIDFMNMQYALNECLKKQTMCLQGGVKEVISGGRMLKNQKLLNELEEDIKVLFVNSTNLMKTNIQSKL